MYKSIEKGMRSNIVNIKSISICAISAISMATAIATIQLLLNIDAITENADAAEIQIVKLPLLIYTGFSALIFVLSLWLSAITTKLKIALKNKDIELMYMLGYSRNQLKRSSYFSAVIRSIITTAIGGALCLIIQATFIRYAQEEYFISPEKFSYLTTLYIIAAVLILMIVINVRMVSKTINEMWKRLRPMKKKTEQKEN